MTYLNVRVEDAPGEESLKKNQPNYSIYILLGELLGEFHRIETIKTLNIKISA